MIQLIYTSAAVEPFSAEDLDLLLLKSRARNTANQVSGMLVYHNGSFLQVLEGPEENVDVILASILRDPRHTASRILSRERFLYREFRSWAMGFVDTSLASSHPEGFVDYFRDLPRLSNTRTLARNYLLTFQEGSHREHVPAGAQTGG